MRTDPRTSRPFANRPPSTTQIFGGPVQKVGCTVLQSLKKVAALKCWRLVSVCRENGQVRRGSVLPEEGKSPDYQLGGLRRLLESALSGKLAGEESGELRKGAGGGERSYFGLWPFYLPVIAIQMNRRWSFQLACRESMPAERSQVRASF